MFQFVEQHPWRPGGSWPGWGTMGQRNHGQTWEQQEVTSWPRLAPGNILLAH